MDGEFKPHLWSGGKALLNQRVCKIASDGELNNIFLRFALEDPLYFIQKSISGTTVKHLSKSGIKDINLPTPPVEEQKKIAAILWNIESLIKAHVKMVGQTDDPDDLDNATLRAVRKKLMRKLLSGEIRTTEKEIEIPDIIEKHG